MPEAKQKWQNRIIGHGEKPATEFNFNPLNWRQHPESQQAALREILEKVGWVTGVIENSRTGHLIDGHGRVAEALKSAPSTSIPFTKVDLTEAEEKLILLLLDPIGNMATADEAILQELFDLVGLDSDSHLEALQSFIDIVPPFEDLGEEFFLPDGDREEFQQVTFSVTDAQAETIKTALAKAKSAGPFTDTGNQNSNGNALARIAESYV